ncbi:MULTISPECIES: RNA-binding S4 domain-containing protein [unclassified Streptomyces]|uniref:RNA-binding S4 domain-containing protein n=1 Tax=unclassified Streptomyces TaxID=2593676 RepID=UPI002255894F|nr:MULTISPECIES: RNA-binding S4 domain-containing protein [unclassified Streptomyces]MCX4963517.1 RNA-binding S4 domain-containing protein [Streptomyces sp. NBC_00654]MEE1739899.1 RNA-binding S4 domain-containing protein [Streptomyces sp. BE147]
MVSGDAPQTEGSVRVDVWIWSVRLTKTRSQAAAACRAGHVKVGGVRAKPAQTVGVGDEVRLRHAGRDRIVVVSKIVKKRVGPPVAAECFVDNSPPPPPREVAIEVPVRDRGAGRPTKRDRREMERLQGRAPEQAPGPRH